MLCLGLNILHTSYGLLPEPHGRVGKYGVQTKREENQSPVVQCSTVAFELCLACVVSKWIPNVFFGDTRLHTDAVITIISLRQQFIVQFRRTGAAADPWVGDVFVGTAAINA